jgi:hypothetical protein
VRGGGPWVGIGPVGSLARVWNNYSIPRVWNSAGLYIHTHGNTKMQQGAFALLYKCTDSVIVFHSTIRPARSMQGGNLFCFRSKKAISVEPLLRFLIRLHQVVEKNVLNKMRSMKTIFGELFFKYVIAT